MITPYSNTISVTTLSNLLLDTYSGAAAAYSLRKLRTAYTGSAIRVRIDTTGQPEYNIGFVNNELDVSTLQGYCTGGLNAYVKTWYDQSGNGYDATQSTAASQPQIVSSGSVLTLNSKPTIKFNGTDDWMLINAVFTSNILLSAWNVSSVTNPNSTQYIFGNPNNNSYGGGYVHRYQTGNYWRVYSQNANLYAQGGAITSNTQNLVGGISTGTTTETNTAFLNGSQIGTTSGSTLTRDAYSTTNIGRSEKFGGYLTGNIQEIIAYNFDQSSNRTGIESNINSFYSIY